MKKVPKNLVYMELDLAYNNQRGNNQESYKWEGQGMKENILLDLKNIGGGMKQGPRYNMENI